MKIEHIVWTDHTNETEGTGLIDLRLHYHGDSKPTRMMVWGSFEIVKEGWSEEIVITGPHRTFRMDSREMMGLSGMSIVRIGQIVE
jgi:hypothetical protein